MCFLGGGPVRFWPSASSRRRHGCFVVRYVDTCFFELIDEVVDGDHAVEVSTTEVGIAISRLDLERRRPVQDGASGRCATEIKQTAVIFIAVVFMTRPGQRPPVGLVYYALLPDRRFYRRLW